MHAKIGIQIGVVVLVGAWFGAGGLLRAAEDRMVSPLGLAPARDPAGGIPVEQVQPADGVEGAINSVADALRMGRITGTPVSEADTDEVIFPKGTALNAALANLGGQLNLAYIPSPWVTEVLSETTRLRLGSRTQTLNDLLEPFGYRAIVNRGTIELYGGAVDAHSPADVLGYTLRNITFENSAQADDFTAHLGKLFLSAKGAVYYDQASRSVVAKDGAGYLEQLRGYLERIDQPQNSTSTRLRVLEVRAEVSDAPVAIDWLSNASGDINQRDGISSAAMALVGHIIRAATEGTSNAGGGIVDRGEVDGGELRSLWSLLYHECEVRTLDDSRLDVREGLPARFVIPGGTAAGPGDELTVVSRVVFGRRLRIRVQFAGQLVDEVEAAEGRTLVFLMPAKPVEAPQPVPIAGPVTGKGTPAPNVRRTSGSVRVVLLTPSISTAVDDGLPYFTRDGDMGSSGVVVSQKPESPVDIYQPDVSSAERRRVPPAARQPYINLTPQ